MAQTGPLQLRFVQSASQADQLPQSVCEIAIVGRSNVGKSSLLNALANRNKLAKTSKTPGATRLINIFELDPVESGRWVVDLPGYGFAKVSHTERKKWQQMIEKYLTTRDQLAAVLHLIDGEIGPTPLDLQTVDWLRSIEMPVRFVGTKIDKVGPSKRPTRKKDFASALYLEKSDIAFVSASKNIGLDDLRADIRRLLEV
jgi:GTP-binding protein